MAFMHFLLTKSVKSVAFLLFAASAYAQVLLVVNENSAESVALGNYYTSKRNITNVCRLRTAESDTISREGFERDILNPVADYLRANSLQDRILYIVTTRGVPMMVEGDLISVDSALTLVYRYMLTGSFPYQARTENPYFTVTGNFRPFLRRDFDIYLVTRLTATDLVDRALSAEAGGDFYFDLDSPQPTTESDWVQQAAALLKKSGFKATVETTAKALENLDGVQGYVSRRATDAPSIKWRAGALATLLDKDAGRSTWSYVTSGVTGLGSYVADPLPDGYFRPQILFPAYTAGYNLAESFYASCRYLGSRQVVIGDPLVAPYAKTPAPAQQTSIDKETGLPELFAQRRIAWLTQKYSTSRDAVVLLLQAEAAEAKGNREEALALADKSLAQDAYLAAATQLKSRLTTPAAVPDPAPAPAPPAPVAAVQEPAQPAAEGPTISMDFPLRLIKKTPIQYPYEARVAQIQGTVIIDLLIDENGQVMKADVVHGNKMLAKAVVNSVKLWRFEPQLENGRPIVSRFTLPINFKFKEK
jgi:uncharacterized protein (TIGR03790 family)